MIFLALKVLIDFTGFGKFFVPLSVTNVDQNCDHLFIDCFLSQNVQNIVFSYNMEAT